MLLVATIATALTSSFASAQQAPNDDRCKASDTNQQTENKQTGTGQTVPTPDGNPSETLADCGGVLKPPSVGDKQMEKPAPKVGKTPIIKPGDLQNGGRIASSPANRAGHHSLDSGCCIDPLVAVEFSLPS